MSERTFALLAKHPITTTAILQNELLQLETSPNYHLSLESLTKPIHSRRKQIIEYPTKRLHIVGQRVTVGTFGGMVTGVGVGWAGWLGWLVNSGEGVFGLMGMDANTAMAVGLLVIVVSIRLGIGSWEKAKKRWWQDWVRVNEGLERDLKVDSFFYSVFMEYFTDSRTQGNLGGQDASTGYGVGNDSLPKKHG